MAKIYYLGNEILQFLIRELFPYETPITFYDGTIEFDADTNHHVVQNLNTDWNNHKIINGELYYRGQLVTINPPGEAWFIRVDAENAVREFGNLPDYSTWTPDEAEANVTSMVLNGWNNTQADAWIDANVTNLAEAKQALKIIAGALIDLRNIASKIAKMMMWLRNIIIRTR